MKKVSIVAAEEQLEWAIKSWRQVQDIWKQEQAQAWSDFSQLADSNASKGLSEAAQAYQVFAVGSQNRHTIRNLSEARRYWSDFLTHSNRVFAKLEQGKKGTKSEPSYRYYHSRAKDRPVVAIHSPSTRR